jgi:hypothetical protein
MKFSPTPFTIDKRYAALLRQRLQDFLAIVKARKTPQLVFVTMTGLRDNSHCKELVDRDVRFDHIIERA